MGQILAIVSSKGGVGKTTTSVNLAASFASLNFPTLLVEADPQCGLVSSFGFDRFEIPLGLSDVARGDARLEDTTYETPVPGLHLVSSNVWTRDEEASYLASYERNPLVLRQSMAALKNSYDYIIIDAPPMLGPITMAVLAAADRFIVPVQTEPHSARTLPRLLDAAASVRTRFNPRLRFDGVALTMFDSRTRMSESVAEEIRGDHPDRTFASVIPRSVRLAEIPASGRPLVVAAPASRGARAYSALAEEILLAHARERILDTDGDDEARLDAGAPGEVVGALITGATDRMKSTGATTGRGAENEDTSGSDQDEWDDRFVDIDTYLKMESNGHGRARKLPDDEWNDEWEVENDEED